MREYDVKFRLSTEARSMEPVERRLERLRQVAEQKGFHISELEIRGEDGERRDMQKERA